MKKYLLPLMAIIAVAGLTGCLKDKGYENQQYGIQIPEQNGISFPEFYDANGTRYVKTIGLNASTSAQTFFANLSLESASPAAKDTKITLVLNNTNVANEGLTPLPTSSYTVPLTVTIPAGKTSAPLTVTVPNSTTLNPTIAYGLGFSIASVDGGNIIAKSMKDVVFAISIKNQYDGVYRLYGGFSRSDLPTYTGVSNSPAGYYEDYFLITSGPGSVDPNIELSTGYGNTQIIYVTGSGYTYFTGVAPRVNIDGTNVTVTAGAAIAPPSVAFTQNATELAASKYYPTGITGVPKTTGKKTIVAHFRWSSAGVDRITTDTFVYKGPR